ncbi:MurR/RpiR family transcriptional regulator [Liquorilactobacillus vini]|uniref:Transcriptional regulator RpiR family protein n=1 Tax=Liquorilactobacillus vini DSM 20605 TaxID=1133569 RepID=A0A0R2C4X0_9LACO|nr:SIS domain-containing protein [Liquorilactobacillus vini]KRM86654.1 transcriptional regulator RpiR family protein [Liquorilactobacillus vini DSM 20605]
MSVAGKILNTEQNLSKSEKKISRFILTNPQKVVEMTVAQLAQAADSSPATVIRLVKHLKISSFTSLKMMLTADLSQQKNVNKAYADISAGENLSEIKNKLLTNAQQTLQETADQIDQTGIKKLIAEVLKKRQLILFGIGASELVAENISQKWSRLGFLSTVDSDLNLLLPKLINADSNSLLWIISNSGESPEALIAAQAARKHQIKVISLTRYGDNSVAQLSDIAVHTSQPPENKNRIAATSSLLAQFMVVDIIFYYLVSQNFDYLVDILQQSKEIVQNYHNNFNLK